MSITPTITLDLDQQAVSTDLSRAIRAYNRVASKPHRLKAWSFVQNWLWNARQDAVRLGVLIRGTQSYTFVSDRYNHAMANAEHTRAMELAGILDYRI